MSARSTNTASISRQSGRAFPVMIAVILASMGSAVPQPVPVEKYDGAIRLASIGASGAAGAGLEDPARDTVSAQLGRMRRQSIARQRAASRPARRDPRPLRVGRDTGKDRNERSTDGKAFEPTSMRSACGDSSCGVLPDGPFGSGTRERSGHLAADERRPRRQPQSRPRG